MRMTLRGTVAALALLVAPTAAVAQPLTFDDRPIATPVTPLGTTYGGLEFAGFFVGSASTSPFVGTVGAGPVSGTQFAYVGQNLPFDAGEIYHPTSTFNLFSGFLGLRSGSGATTGTVTVRGFDALGAEVFTQALTIGGTSTLFTIATPFIDAIEFDVSQLDAQSYLILDDVAVSTVPEPTTLLLLATGLLAVGGVVRVRGRRAA